MLSQGLLRVVRGRNEPRLSPTAISIEDEALKNLSIGGTFQANPQGMEALLEMLEQGFGLQVRREGDDHIYIGDAPPG